MVASVLAACALTTDLDGFSGGPGDGGGFVPPDASAEAAAPETGPPAPATLTPGCKGTHGPAPVKLDTYCIDATEVTTEQYDAFVEAVGLDFNGQPASCTWNTSWTPAIRGGATAPVFGADWCDAVAYCAWAGKRLCRGTNGQSVPFSGDVQNSVADEWFRACTRKGERAFPYGATRIDDACNVKVDGVPGPGPKPAGSLTACEGGYDGVFDMSGNLWE